VSKKQGALATFLAAAHELMGGGISLGRGDGHLGWRWWV